MDALAQGFALDGLRVAPPTGEVSGPGGIAKLDPKVMDLLVLMAGSPGQVMTREALVARLWGNAVVTDDALTRCFYELRRALALAGGDERYRALIETLPKRGYRLNGTVGPDRPAAGSPSAPVASPPKSFRRAWAAVAAATALTAIVAAVIFWRPSDRTADRDRAAIHSIAVLPFLDMSERKDQRYLADGVTEEILNHLAQAANLRVIARTSSFALRDTTLDVRGIGERLGVDYVLEGSVRRSGNRLRVTAQLIHVENDAHAWSQTYDRTLDDLFAVQDEIAASVGAALQVELAGDARRLAAPQDFEAYEQYLRGQDHYHRRAPGDIERAIAYYRRAVEIDPQFAQGWAALAGAYSLMEDSRDPADRSWELQGAAARRAVELDPKLAVAHARLAQYHFRTGNRALAQEHLRTAVALDPNDPLVLGYTASRAVSNGDLKTASEIWRRIAALDPLSAVNRNNLGSILLAAGNTEEAVAALRAGVELNPAGVGNRVNLARALILSGETDEAADILAALPPGAERDFTFSLLVRDEKYGPQAREALARLKAEPADPSSSVRLAEAFAHAGQTDAAIRLLQAARAESERNPAAATHLRMNLREAIHLSPFLAPLKSDPRWPELVASLAPPG